ncbi:SDR family NAD(P)-dependent oxidoreductase [Nocardia barduliensis]|uniref:SDR family NAD(P)-dependent oxidoreductase n=1 Tax=Nocardia barduliensis TaxID=2736643 RepID=UPI0015734371|nr:SDR family NAD(P)-dependent oxidoreductase [Nocardia barduliensis]
MPTVAIVGAGRGMGLAIARAFGAQGFDIALLARNRGKLDDLVARLAADGYTAAAFCADVLDRAALTAALTDAAHRFGGIDVLEYSPAGQPAATTMTSPSRTTAADVQREMEFQLYGAIAATDAVLPAMREAGAGTLLYTTGAGSIDPSPMLANINAAGAALRNWVLNLHKELAGTGVHAAHIGIGVWIGDSAPEGFPRASADQIAPVYWEQHIARDSAERVFTG